MKNRNFNIIFLLSLFLFFPFALSQAAVNEKPFVVCIDPGHGGNDTGACDNGIKEKDINLGVALQLKEDINRRLKDVKVIMTRTDDRFVTLQGRADIANKNKADLFISIHTNSVDLKNPNRKSVAGTSVYALGLHKDKDNLNVAKRENSVIELEKGHNEKYSGFDPSKDESYIIFEMAQKRNLAQSLRFADFAQKQLVSVAGRKDRGVKQAGFWVLWTTSMPSVLVELDFICNPESAEYMGSTKGEKELAQALCNAVEKYYNQSKKSSSITSVQNGSADQSDTKNLTSAQKDNPGGSNSGNSDGSANLAVVSKNKRTDTPPVSSSTRSTTTARKRRSASSRLSSDQRNIETSNIVVKSEKDYLTKTEEKKVEKPVKSEPVKETPKERKKRLALEKKNKEKELKEKNELKKKQEKALAASKIDSNKENNKTTDNKSSNKVVVNNSSSTVNTKQTASTANKGEFTGPYKSRKSLNSKRNKQ